MSAVDSASAVRNPRRPALRDVRTLVAKDARAAVAPLAIAGVLSGAAVVLWALVKMMELALAWKMVERVQETQMDLDLQALMENWKEKD